jgi:quaternary ammonium compound-resistance protein SugE
MAWFILILAGFFEIGWAIGLKAGWTDQGIRIWPLAGSILSGAVSAALLFVAQRSIPIGTAYAVWTGTGAIGVFAVGVLAFREPASLLRLVCVALIASGIIGLKLVAK